MLRHCLTICFLLPAGIQCWGDDDAKAPKLPKPPEGFVWQWCEEADVGLLKPENWHSKATFKNKTLGYFLSKEKIVDDSGFQTGLTLNVVQEVSKKSKMKASEYAVAFVEKMIKDKSAVLKVLPTQKMKSVTSLGCRVRVDGSVMHYFLIADDIQDRMYLFFFESPEKEWDRAWKIGTQMMKNLHLEIPDA